MFTQERTRNQYLTVEHHHLFSSTLLNTLHGGINRSVSLADNVRTIDIPPSMSWIPGEQFGYLDDPGLVTEMAGDFRLPRNDIQQLPDRRHAVPQPRIARRQARLPG